MRAKSSLKYRVTEATCLTECTSVFLQPGKEQLISNTTRTGVRIQSSPAAAATLVRLGHR